MVVPTAAAPMVVLTAVLTVVPMVQRGTARPTVVPTAAAPMVVLTVVLTVVPMVALMVVPTAVPTVARTGLTE
jgi:hypothetical protein